MMPVMRWWELKSRVIAYFSKIMNTPVITYSITQKELLPVVQVARHFRPYMYGRRFYSASAPIMLLHWIYVDRRNPHVESSTLVGALKRVPNSTRWITETQRLTGAQTTSSGEKPLPFMQTVWGAQQAPWWRAYLGRVGSRSRVYGRVGDAGSRWTVGCKLKGIFRRCGKNLPTHTR